MYGMNACFPFKQSRRSSFCSAWNNIPEHLLFYVCCCSNALHTTICVVAQEESEIHIKKCGELETEVDSLKQQIIHHEATLGAKDTAMNMIDKELLALRSVVPHEGHSDQNVLAGARTT